MKNKSKTKNASSPKGCTLKGKSYRFLAIECMNLDKKMQCQLCDDMKSGFSF